MIKATTAILIPGSLLEILRLDWEDPEEVVVKGLEALVDLVARDLARVVELTSLRRRNCTSIGRRFPSWYCHKIGSTWNLPTYDS